MGIKLTEEELELKNSLFSSFSNVEFATTIRAGRWGTAEEGENLITRGEKIDKLILIYSGSALIMKDKQIITQVESGTFVGEIEFVTDKPAQATVITTKTTRYLEWTGNKLKLLFLAHPSIAIPFQTILNQELIRKLEEKV